MKATIQKTDSDGIKSTFTIIGSTEEEIDNQVCELQEWAKRNSIYPSERYEVLNYGLHKNIENEIKIN